MNERPKVEPTAAMRTNALLCFQWYTALRDGGFDEDQALKIIGAMLGGQR